MAGLEISPIEDKTLLHELQDPAERLLNRHLETSRVWYPHETIPWNDASCFGSKDSWDDNETGGLSQAVKSALFVNLLTEDNLPYYAHTIINNFSDESPFNQWSRRWVAEENRHALVLRDWVLITHSLNPWELEDARMKQMSDGMTPQLSTGIETIVYAALQELATNIAHRNTGRMLMNNTLGKKVMGLIAGDELLHHRFYRDIAKEALKINPSTTTNAIAKQLVGFKMPGTGIPNFTEHSERIARAGIYGLREFIDGVAKPTIDYWKIEDLKGLTSTAEKSREKIIAYMGLLARVVKRYEET